MNKKEIIEKIKQKKMYSELPERDVLRAFEKFDREEFSDEEKIKKTREFLGKIYSGFSGQKILTFGDKTPEEILKKHLSTRERYEHYGEIYSRLLKNLPEEISIIDLGSGVNGFSYDFFEKVGKEVDYVGVEAVGQLVEFTNSYFKKTKIKNAEAVHASLFDLDEVKKIIQSAKKPKVVFLFKVIDSLEKTERNYTKKLLQGIVPLADKIVVSFATESWTRRRKFFARRKWLVDFIRENWQFTDDFEVGGERYLCFRKD